MENHKLLLKTTKLTEKWKDQQYALIGKLSAVNMSVLPWLIYPLNAISVKYQQTFFPGTRQGGYKVHTEEKTSKNNYKNPGKGAPWVR